PSPLVDERLPVPTGLLRQLSDGALVGIEVLEPLPRSTDERDATVLTRLPVEVVVAVPPAEALVGVKVEAATEYERVTRHPDRVHQRRHGKEGRPHAGQGTRP